MIDITTEVCRLVSGHPMVAQAQKDDNNQPKMLADGSPMIKFYAGLAFAKKPGETDWKETDWGKQMLTEAMSSFPNGEYQNPNFAWKVEDGDSTTPNEKGKIPNQREGWPGHWIVHASNLSPMACYHDGKPITPFNAIKDKNEIKTGDYLQVILQVKDNKGPKTRKLGMYVNLSSVLVVRAGQRIMGVNEPDSAALFGAVSHDLPVNALVENATAATTTTTTTTTAPAPTTTNITEVVTQASTPPKPGTAVAPAPDVLIPPPPATDFKVNVDGVIHLASVLKAAEWSDEQIAAYPKA